MAVGTPLDIDPAIQYIDDFAGARDSHSPGVRVEEMRNRARAFRERMLGGAEATFYKSVSLIRVPYPRRYGLRDACPLPTPYIHITNRMFVVQFDSPDGMKTLLVSPSDIHGNRETPFFKRLGERFGPFSEPINKILAPIENTVDTALAKVGLAPADVDYITYDHLHTQDLRKWLGTHDTPGYFPNAKLLIMRQEWESTLALAPPQYDWYCPHGLDGIPEDKIVLLDGDVMLGESVALLHTPGHTEGNHSIAVHTPEGILITSENGVGADAYAPQKSGIPGLRRYAESTGQEVVLNSNTLERGLDQYISMIQEKEVGGPSQRNPDFYNVMSSSELTPYYLFPGISPTFRFGELEFGALRQRGQ